jgi:hypothetical protein
MPFPGSADPAIIAAISPGQLLVLALQFFLTVMGVYPAAWQCFAGKKSQIGLAEGLRVLGFLTMLITANQVAAKRVKQVLQCQYFNKVIVALAFQKHGDLL